MLPRPAIAAWSNQQGLQGTLVPAENQLELLDPESLRQRFGSKSLQHCFPVRHEKDPAELARVAEPQLPPGSESKNGVIVGCAAGPGRSQEEVAAHHQVNDEGIAVERHQNELAPAIDVTNNLPPDSPTQACG